MPDYFVDGDGTLHNKLGIVDENLLKKREDDIVALHISEVLNEPDPREFDFDYLLALHRRLFGEIYDFAGQIRTVNIMKPDGEAPFAYAEFIPSEAARIFTQLKHDRYLVGLKKAEFVQKISALAADLNALHPFREGNGRTIRLFLALLAKHAGYIIDYSQVSHEEVILADKLAFGGKYDVIVKLYNRITTPAANQHSVR